MHAITLRAKLVVTTLLIVAAASAVWAQGARPAVTDASALATYLLAIQNRIADLAARLDIVRKDVDIVARDARRFANDLVTIERNRAEAIQAGRPFHVSAESTREELARLTSREQTLRAREAALDKALQAEETRWTTLSGRLEQMLGR
jgi:chromosome segregation ATPase